MEKIVVLSEFFYNAHHIPIYIYKNKKLVVCFPQQASFCCPDSDLFDNSCNPETFLSYITPENLFMGYLSLEKNNIEILLGPVSPLPFTTEQLSKLLYKRKTRKEDHEECIMLYQSIPNHSHVEFVDIILFLQFSLTGNKITRDDFFLHQGNTTADTAYNSFLQNHVDADIYSLELHKNELILEYIENGNSDAVFQYLCSQQTTLPAVSFGSTPLTYRKNLCFYSIALFSEAAQRGGLSMLESTEIAASYYNDISSAATIEKVDLLTGRAALFFANKVASTHFSSDVSATLLNCIQFIRHNVYNHIEVSDVASFIGYSRTHTARLFKQELGFSPSQLIMRTKLEEAKTLLKHTNKSLSEISNALCFSNQSHFQRSFKNHFHMTPMEYRQGLPAADSVHSQQPHTTASHPE